MLYSIIVKKISLILILKFKRGGLPSLLIIFKDNLNKEFKVSTRYKDITLD